MERPRPAHGYGPEERTARFAGRVCAPVQAMSRTLVTAEIAQQLVRSAGSAGANDIEANESLGDGVS